MSSQNLADITIKITSIINEHLAKGNCPHCKELFKEFIDN